VKKRTIEQILEEVKAATAHREDVECSSTAPFGPIAIRLDKSRFIIVREIIETDGIAPGDTNIYFTSAIAAAETFGIIKPEEAMRLYAWRRERAAAIDRRREREDLERAAAKLGFKLVKAGKGTK